MYPVKNDLLGNANISTYSTLISWHLLRSGTAFNLFDFKSLQNEYFITCTSDNVLLVNLQAF